VPFTQLRVLGLLADVLHDRVAEVIHHRRDGEDAAQPLLLGLRVCFIRRRQYARRSCGEASALRPRFVL
jgi:hypothetical protein